MEIGPNVIGGMTGAWFGNVYVGAAISVLLGGAKFLSSGIIDYMQIKNWAASEFKKHGSEYICKMDFRLLCIGILGVIEVNHEVSSMQ